MTDPAARYRLLTLTAPKLKMASAYRDWDRMGITDAWKALTRKLRRRNGSFEYFRAAERQPHRGVLHFHVVTRGLELPNRVILEMAKSAGFGHTTIKNLDLDASNPQWDYSLKDLLMLQVQGTERYRPTQASNHWRLDEQASNDESAGTQEWIPLDVRITRGGVSFRARQRGELIDLELSDATALLEEAQAYGRATTRNDDQEKLRHALSTKRISDREAESC